MGGPNPQDTPGSHAPNIRSRPPPSNSESAFYHRSGLLVRHTKSNRLQPTPNYAPTGPNARQPAQH